ncbi:hypothetical protein F5X99DRAFT_398500 [Biscogniauxia marginata]|nr:hypothetical protein F5X99DRAFT_398500 [Biscogniauxia marginata]
MATSMPAVAQPVQLSDGPLELTRTDFNPTPADIDTARRILQTLLPPELTLEVLSFASYYPRLRSTRHSRATYEANSFPIEITIAGLYLTTASLPDLNLRAKRITFQMRSADQGWATFGGNETYHNSHTWFEASILRPNPGVSRPTPPTNINMESFSSPEGSREYLWDHGWELVENNGTVVWRVHNNITARREFTDYRVDWVAGVPTEIDDPRATGDGAGFLELLQPRDAVALWARAELGCWVNEVQAATIEIEYDV